MGSTYCSRFPELGVGHRKVEATTSALGELSVSGEKKRTPGSNWRPTLDSERSSPQGRAPAGVGDSV